MTKAKHTATPWMLGDIRTKFGSRLVYDSKDDRVADCSSSPDDVQVQEANARLIAAAPDLLKACKKAYRELMSGNSTIGTRPEMAIFIREVLKEAN